MFTNLTKNSLYLHAFFTISKVQNTIFISGMRLCQYQSFLLRRLYEICNAVLLVKLDLLPRFSLDTSYVLLIFK